MSGKLTVRCLAWRPLCRNTLRGFAVVEVVEMGMKIREVAAHESHGRAWAQPPSRPWVKDGALVIGDDGKIKYQPLFGLGSHAVRAAFSDAVIRAVLEFDPHALECGESAA
jgi:hypothetical protein